MDALLLFKASLLLVVAFAAASLLRDAPAALRHRLWSLAFGALLVLPVLAVALPALHVPVPQPWAAWAGAAAEGADSSRPPSGGGLPAFFTLSVGGSERGVASAGSISGHGGSGPRANLDGPTMPGFSGWLVVWMAGTIAATSALLLSLVRVGRLFRSAEPLDDPEWRNAADALGTRLGLRRPARLLVSAAIDTPMAGGLLRPVVYLPASSRGWDSQRRDVVLAHEIAHLAGRDPLRHVTARLAVAVYWFHPLAWIAARQSAVSREQACDEAVLSLGLRRSTYARVLLEMAESVRPPDGLLNVLPMVEPSLLERRLMAILNNQIRPETRRRGIGLAVAGALVTLSIAAARPTAPSEVPVSPPSLGRASIPDPTTKLPVVDAIKPVEGILAPAAAEDQRGVDRGSACWLEPSGAFSGTMSMSESGGRTIVYEQVGSRGADWIIQKTLGDLRLCMVAEGVGDRDDSGRPSDWPDRARRVLIEVHRGTRVERLEMARESGAAQRVSWEVGGAQHAFDRNAEEWRDRTLAVLDTTWELSRLHGQVSSLQGQISSVRGEESSLRGEISSLMGEVSSMRGHASSVQGEESNLRGQISSIQGRVSSMQGGISSQQGSISSLEASRYGLDGAERERIGAQVKRHRDEIARIEKEIADYNAEARIADVEREIRALDAPGKVAAIEADIRRFDLDGKVAAVERRITELGVAGKVSAIEAQIKALDVDRRSRELEARREKQLKDLEAAIAAIR
jgi:beta-lactamase regulating signal transducer with metallopeptidase domain